MREVFQRHLEPLDGRTYRVRGCTITHTRYRMGARCLLQYSLLLEEPATGREREQWVAGTMYAAGRTRQVWEELRRAGGGPSGAPAGPFAPFSYIPDLDMLAQVFPYDRQLPALSLLMAEPPGEIEAPLLARFGPGAWQTERWSPEPVRYLIEKRATVRVTVRARDMASGRAQERRFYAKVYQDVEAGERTYEALRTLWERAGDEGFTVGMPIAYLGELRTLLQGEVSGISLKRVLNRGEAAIPVVRRVARALARLHLDDRVVTQRRHHLHDEVADLERAGRSLRQGCPPLSSKIEETVGAVLTGLEEVPPAPTHGDLKPVHILIDGDRIALIDLDGFAAADPVLDVARLLIPLTGLPSRTFSISEPPAVARSFVEEYFARVPDAWRARLPFHYASGVLKVAAGNLRHQPPGWSEKIEAMVKEASASAAGKVW
jgi:hypothetical protein